MSKDRPAQESPIRDCFDFSTYGPGPPPRKAPGWATSRGRCPMSGEPKTCPARAPGLLGCCVERPRASHQARAPRRIDPSLSRSGLGDVITSSSLPVPRGREQLPGRPSAVVADLHARRRKEGIGSTEDRSCRHAASFAKADSEARQGLSRACEDKAPAGSRWNRPGLCRAAGGRGMGGTRPAQVQRSILAGVPGLRPIFLCKGRLEDEGFPGPQPAAPRSTA
jgi:hypothetical protein